MACKWCKGTGKITLLFSEVDCDCVTQEPVAAPPDDTLETPLTDNMVGLFLATKLAQLPPEYQFAWCGRDCQRPGWKEKHANH